jgi:hypothetical protein
MAEQRRQLPAGVGIRFTQRLQPQFAQLGLSLDGFFASTSLRAT